MSAKVRIHVQVASYVSITWEATNALTGTNAPTTHTCAMKPLQPVTIQKGLTIVLASRVMKESF